MNRNARIFSFLVITLAALAGCSSEPAGKEAKKAVTLDKIQGKAQVLDESGSSDAALNAGGSSVYIWVGVRRYRLFLLKPADVTHGKEYAVEGVWAQKAIDDIGDPDNGKNGYPLQASCERVVRMAWGNAVPFDSFDPTVSLVMARVKRYPARPLFLVTKIAPVDASAEPKKEAAAEDKNIPEVPAEKQRALLTAGPTVQTAPLWQPEGGTVKCKVLIDGDGKIADLESGTQLCETVPWDQFHYQPTLQGGKPVKVRTEVEVRFDPRK